MHSLTSLIALMYMWLFSQYRGPTQNIDHRHIIAHSWAWYTIGVGIREWQRKMYEESRRKKCSLKNTGHILWNEPKYNAIKGTTAMEWFWNQKKVEDGEIMCGMDIAVLSDMFDPLRKTEMKVGDIWHRWERQETFHCHVDKILSKLDEFINVHGDAKKRSREYWHHALSLEGIHDYSLLLPPEQCKQETMLENLRYEKRFDSDNEYNINDWWFGWWERRGNACLRCRWHEPYMQTPTYYPTWGMRAPGPEAFPDPCQGESPMYSRDKTPSRRERARSRGSSLRRHCEREESAESGGCSMNESRGKPLVNHFLRLRKKNAIAFRENIAQCEWAFRVNTASALWWRFLHYSHWTQWNRSGMGLQRVLESLLDKM